MAVYMEVSQNSCPLITFGWEIAVKIWNSLTMSCFFHLFRWTNLTASSSPVSIFWHFLMILNLPRSMSSSSMYVLWNSWYFLAVPAEALLLFDLMLSLSEIDASLTVVVFILLISKPFSVLSGLNGVIIGIMTLSEGGLGSLLVLPSPWAIIRK